MAKTLVGVARLLVQCILHAITLVTVVLSCLMDDVLQHQGSVDTCVSCGEQFRSRQGFANHVTALKHLVVPGTSDDEDQSLSLKRVE